MPSRTEFRLPVGCSTPIPSYADLDLRPRRLLAKPEEEVPNHEKVVNISNSRRRALDDRQRICREEV